MKRGILKWTVVADVFLAHSTVGPVSDAIWELFVNDLKTKQYSKFLASSSSAVELTSVQRKSASEALTKRNIPSAVITDERLVRGIVTAASWLGVNIKSFSWTEMREAIRHLGVPRENEDRVVDGVMKLRSACEDGRA